MSVEMACGSCQGRFLVTAAGTVACPHCGTHLVVSAADCPPSVDASKQTTVEVDEPATTPEPATVAPAPAEPAGAMLANHAGLADAGQTETTETEAPESESTEQESDGATASPAAAPPVTALPATAPADDENADRNSSDERLSPDKEQDIVQTPAETNAETNAETAVETISDDGEVAAEGTVGLVAPLASIDEAAAAVPDFAAIETAESDSVPEESPAEFASFESEIEAPTLTFMETGQKHEGLGGEELPSAMFEEGVSPFEEGNKNRDTSGEFPDFSDAADEDDGDGLDDLLAGASTEATIIENSLDFNAAPPPAQDEFAAPVEMTAGASETADQGMVPKTWFLILVSYASAMTLVCLWLLWQIVTGTHQLESLEDPAEAAAPNGKKIVQLYQVNMELPDGHLLRLGESRRFGNILVEPMKVTRGPLKFVHFSSDEAALAPSPEPTAPTLKLWLRLENLSDDQTIAPLDRLMLYDNRVFSEENFEDFRGNTFVCRASDKRKGGKLFYVYNLNTDDSWDLRDQPLEPLAPGGNCETYIPSSLGDIDQLKGDLVWRVHVRKGYSAAEHGVTTLIEINFHSDEIQNEPSSPAKQKTAKQETAAL
jgi:hypothetical protein